MIIDKTGDIFTSTAPAIGHGVNCEGVMGKGIAVEFKTRYPDMYEAYREICASKSLKPGLSYMWIAEDKVIANIASQDLPGPNARYAWTIQGINAALNWCESNGIDRLAIPRIGAGIGGLKWADMYYLIVDQLNDHAVDLEVWTYA